MGKKIDLDSTDRQIIDILLQDANTPYVDIAKRIHVSPGTVHVRMKRLKEQGLIKGAFINIDYDKIGLGLCAFLGINLEKGLYYDNVIAALNKIPEIVSAYYVTGVYGILAKVICRDAEHLRQVLHDKINSITGIQRTETFICLEEPIQRSISIADEDEDLPEIDFD